MSRRKTQNQQPRSPRKKWTRQKMTVEQAQHLQVDSFNPANGMNAANDNSPERDGLQPGPANDNSPQPLNAQPLQSLIPEELTSEAHSSSTSDSGAHLEALEAETAATQTADQGGAQEMEIAPAIVSREQFRASIIGAFNFGGLFLKSFAITDPEKPSAEAAADALYETALEVHWLRWLLDPQATTVQRVIIILSFIGPKAKAILAEVQAARKAKPKDPEPAAAGIAAAHSGPRDPEPAR